MTSSPRHHERRRQLRTPPADARRPAPHFVLSVDASRPSTVATAPGAGRRQSLPTMGGAAAGALDAHRPATAEPSVGSRARARRRLATMTPSLGDKYFGPALRYAAEEPPRGRGYPLQPVAAHTLALHARPGRRQLHHPHPAEEGAAPLRPGDGLLPWATPHGPRLSRATVMTARALAMDPRLAAPLAELTDALAVELLGAGAEAAGEVSLGAELDAIRAERSGFSAAFESEWSALARDTHNTRLEYYSPGYYSPEYHSSGSPSALPTPAGVEAEEFASCSAEGHVRVARSLPASRGGCYGSLPASRGAACAAGLGAQPSAARPSTVGGAWAGGRRAAHARSARVRSARRELFAAAAAASSEGAPAELAEQALLAGAAARLRAAGARGSMCPSARLSLRTLARVVKTLEREDALPFGAGAPAAAGGAAGGAELGAASALGGLGPQTPSSAGSASSRGLDASPALRLSRLSQALLERGGGAHAPRAEREAARRQSAFAPPHPPLPDTGTRRLAAGALNLRRQLLACPLFHGVHRSEIERAIRATRVRAVERYATVHRESYAAAGAPLELLLNGAVTLYGFDGVVRTLHSTASGVLGAAPGMGGSGLSGGVRSFLGIEAAAADAASAGRLRTDTAVAAVPSVLASIPSAVLPPAARHIARVLANLRLLKASPTALDVFADLPEWQLSQLSQRFVFRCVQQGEVLTRQGEPAGPFWSLVHGAVEIIVEPTAPAAAASPRSSPAGSPRGHNDAAGAAAAEPRSPRQTPHARLAALARAKGAEAMATLDEVVGPELDGPDAHLLPPTPINAAEAIAAAAPPSLPPTPSRWRERGTAVGDWLRLPSADTSVAAPVPPGEEEAAGPAVEGTRIARIDTTSDYKHFGEMGYMAWLSSGNPAAYARKATVVATEPAWLLEMPVAYFSEVFELMPYLAERFTAAHAYHRRTAELKRQVASEHQAKAMLRRQEVEARDGARRDLLLRQVARAEASELSRLRELEREMLTHTRSRTDKPAGRMSLTVRPVPDRLDAAGAHDHAHARGGSPLRAERGLSVLRVSLKPVALDAALKSPSSASARSSMRSSVSIAITPAGGEGD